MNKLAVVLPLLAMSASAYAAPAATPNPIKNPIGAIFAKVAEARGGRAFHFNGAGYHATITDADGTVHSGEVRVSRGGITKTNKPDVQGLAIKVHGAAGDQDYTLITAKAPGAYLPTLKDTEAGQPMSSVTSYRMGKTKGTIATQLPPTFHTLMDSSPVKPTGDQSFDLTMRSSHVFGPSKTVKQVANVTVHFDQPLTATEEKNLKFSPYHDAGGVKPTGIINAIRKLAMHGSQEGRGASPDDQADAR
jgi:hypothetical protein